jgi:hypothetical protein
MTNPFWDGEWMEEQYRALYFQDHGHFPDEECPTDCKGRRDNG